MGAPLFKTQGWAQSSPYPVSPFLVYRVAVDLWSNINAMEYPFPHILNHSQLGFEMYLGTYKISVRNFTFLNPLGTSPAAL